MKKGNKTLTVKMMLSTSLSGRDGGSVKKKWSAKKRIPLEMKIPRKMKKKLKKLPKFMGLFLLTAVMAATAVTVGCAPASYSEPEEVSTVSALGFDVSEKGIRVSVQTAEKGGESVKVISGEGESVSFALSHLSGGDERRTELSHCAVIVIGDGVEGDLLREIFELCESDDDITDAVLLVGTHDACALLSLEGAAGFDMVSAMRPSSDGAGMFSKNRFYEIKSAEKAGVMALPYFYITENEYSLQGLKLYTDLAERTILDRRESALYLMMRGIFTSGRVDAINGDTVTTASVDRARTSYRVSDELLEVDCVLSLEETVPSEVKGALAEYCEKGARELYDQLTLRYGDVFGFAQQMGGATGCVFRFAVE